MSLCSSIASDLFCDSLKVRFSLISLISGEKLATRGGSSAVSTVIVSIEKWSASTGIDAMYGGRSDGVLLILFAYLDYANDNGIVFFWNCS